MYYVSYDGSEQKQHLRNNRTFLKKPEFRHPQRNQKMFEITVFSRPSPKAFLSELGGTKNNTNGT
jgi:hypothetical protein